MNSNLSQSSNSQFDQLSVIDPVTSVIDPVTSVTHTPSSKPVFHYVFGCNCESDYFGLRRLESNPSNNTIKTMDTNISWDNARFLIEQRHGFFDVKKKKSDLTNSYIVGYFWTPDLLDWRKQAKIVPSTHILTEKDNIIVVRKPLKTGALLYVPNQYRPEFEKEKTELMQQIIKENPKNVQFNDTMSEEEKMNMLIGSDASNEKIKSLYQLYNHQKKQYASYHPSETEKQPQVFTKPPLYYQCHRCGIKGHWKHQCPTLTNPTFVSLDKIKNAFGIPKSLLKMAISEEEKKMAMMTSDGNFMVLK